MDFIEQWEGRKYTAYRCSEGYLTIGVGHRIHKDIGELTDKEIDRFLLNDTLTAIRAAKETVSSFDEQPKIIRLVLVDMAFNLGKRGLSRFKNTINACNAKDYVLMSKEMIDSKWFRQTGVRSRHHVKAVRNEKN